MSVNTSPEVLSAAGFKNLAKKAELDRTLSKEDIAEVQKNAKDEIDKLHKALTSSDTNDRNSILDTHMSDQAIRKELVDLINEVRANPASVAPVWVTSAPNGTPASVPAWVYSPDIQSPTREVSKDTNMPKIEVVQAPKLGDIESSAKTLEKNFSVWLLKAQDQWDEIQMIADPAESENDFRNLANFLNKNKPTNVLNLSRRNNMLILTDLLNAARNNNSTAVVIQWRTLYEHSDPQMRLNWIFDQIKDMNNRVVDEANNGTFGVTDLVVWGLSTAFTIGLPTSVFLWYLYGKTKIKGRNLPGAERSNSAFKAFFGDIFHGGTADISKLPKETQQILDEFIMKEVNRNRSTPYTEAEFKDTNHEAYKELKRRQNLVEQHFKGGMSDTFVADLYDKTGADQRRRLRELGAAVQGKERGNVLRPYNTVTSALKAPWATVPLVWWIYPTSANPNVIKWKELLTMMKKWIPVEEVVVKWETLKVKPDELTLARQIQSLGDAAEKKVTEENNLIEKRETELRNMKTTEQSNVEKLKWEIDTLKNEVSSESHEWNEQRVRDAKSEKARFEWLLSNQRTEVVSASGEIATASAEIRTQSGIISGFERNPLIKSLEWKRVALAQAQAESPIDDAKVAKAQAEFETAKRAAESDVSQLEEARRKYNDAEAKKAQAEAKKAQAEAEISRLEWEVRDAQGNVEKAKGKLEKTSSEADKRTLRSNVDIQADITKKQWEKAIAEEKIKHIDQALRDPRKMDALLDAHFADFKRRFDVKITNLRSEIDALVSWADGINKYLAELHIKYPTKIPTSVAKWVTKISDVEILKLGELYEAIIKAIGKRAAH